MIDFVSDNKFNKDCPSKPLLPVIITLIIDYF